MMTTPPRTTTETADPVHVVTEVIQILLRCAELGLADGRPNALAVGLGADLVAQQAMDLIPDVAVDASGDRRVMQESDPVALLQAAERLTRHPIEVFPPGMSQVIAGICDLLRQNVP